MENKGQLKLRAFKPLNSASCAPSFQQWECTCQAAIPREHYIFMSTEKLFELAHGFTMHKVCIHMHNMHTHSVHTHTHILYAIHTY